MQFSYVKLVMNMWLKRMQALINFELNKMREVYNVMDFVFSFII